MHGVRIVASQPFIDPAEQASAVERAEFFGFYGLVEIESRIRDPIGEVFAYPLFSR